MDNFKKTAETFVAGSLTMPQKYYTSTKILVEEKEKIFKKFWICVGHQSRIPNPGEYFLQEVFDDSLIVLRDKVGKIRVFHNVCRHRGTRICETPEGKFNNSIQCSYHAWTYGLDGKLIGAPFMKEIDSFPWEDFPLLSLPVQVWEGFIFISLGKDPTPFTEVYAPMLSRLEPWKVSGLKAFHREVYDVQANWKYVFQNFNECYHCPTIHPMLNRLTNYTSAENDLAEGPFLGGYMEITGGESMTTTGRMCGLPLGEMNQKTIKRGYYYTLLPNLLLNIHPDYLMYHLVFPRSTGQSRVISEWMFNENSLGRTDFRPEEAIAFWQETNLQDWHVCELAQLGVQSSGYRQGWYSPRESLLAAFDVEYLKLME